VGAVEAANRRHSRLPPLPQVTGRRDFDGKSKFGRNWLARYLFSATNNSGSTLTPFK
jgi:hypothetical protein